MTAKELFYEGQQLFISGDFDQSIELFAKAEREGFNPATIHFSCGVAYLYLRDMDKAAVEFGKVVDTDPNNDRAYYYRGIVHMNNDNIVEAEKDLTQSILLNHERGGATFLARSIVNAELGKDEESVRDMQTAIAFSNIEVENFAHHFGENRTMLDKSIALLEGERGPWSIVLDEIEIEQLKKWMG